MAVTSSALFYAFKAPHRPPHCLAYSLPPPLLPSPLVRLSWRRQTDFEARICCASVSASPEVRTTADDLAASLLSKVTQTDRGVLLSREEHQEVAELAGQLQRYCVSEPVKCPLIFGEWDVVYCSVSTTGGGPYRSAFGRLFFQTKEMIQVLDAPNIVENKVSFSALGLIDAEVSLKGKLKISDDKWLQVVFEQPEIKVGAWHFQYGGESEVKFEIHYVDENIRLFKGARGTIFVFKRRKQAL